MNEKEQSFNAWAEEQAYLVELENASSANRDKREQFIGLKLDTWEVGLFGHQLLNFLSKKAVPEGFDAGLPVQFTLLGLDHPLKGIVRSVEYKTVQIILKHVRCAQKP